MVFDGVDPRLGDLLFSFLTVGQLPMDSGCRFLLGLVALENTHNIGQVEQRYQGSPVRL